MGIGYTVGPVTGGFLYEVGGFFLPFLVYGIASLVRKCKKQEFLTQNQEKNISANQTRFLSRIYQVIDFYQEFFCDLTLP